MRIGIDGRKIADFGIGTYLRGLLGGLAELGGDEEYVVLAPAGARSAIPARFEHVVADAPHYSLRELVRFGREADRARLDLFHAPHYVVPFLSTPFVVTVHDLIHLRDPRPLARLYARRMIGRAVGGSRRVMTVSESVRQEIVSRFGASPDHVVVTPNAAGPAFTSEGPRASGRYLLAVGNDKPHKNIETLVGAFGRMGRKDLQLVLVGAPFARYGGTDGVVVPGFVSESELAALYRGAIGVVVPSREEGFGLSALEAMACGTPVITSEATALVEITGDAALHAEASVDGLGEAIERLLADEPLRRDLAARGPRRARDFSWRRSAEIAREVYRSALSASR